MDSGGGAYAAFLALHGQALSASAVPKRFWPALWRKLHAEALNFSKGVLRGRLACSMVGSRLPRHGHGALQPRKAPAEPKLVSFGSGDVVPGGAKTDFYLLYYGESRDQETRRSIKRAQMVLSTHRDPGVKLFHGVGSCFAK